MSTSMAEQETIIIAGRADDYVHVYTSNPFDLAYFRKNPEFELMEEHLDGQTGEVTAADFRIPAERANVRKILKRKVSEDAKERARETMRKTREAGNLS